MKKIITTVAMCLMVATAFSQSAESMTLESEPQKFFSFEVFYAPSHYIYTGDDLTIDDDEPFKQIGLGISNNTPLSKKINLYLNWGVAFVFSDYEWESEPYDFLGYQKPLKFHTYTFRDCTKPMWAICFRYRTPLSASSPI